jgi:hypothetical protein
MRIESSTLQMQAQHVATRVHAQTSRLETWVGERPSNAMPRPNPTTPAVQISNAARLAQAAHSVLSPPPEQRITQGIAPPSQRVREEGLTPQLSMIRDLIERLTGVFVRVFTGTELASPPPDALPELSAAANDATPAPPRAGFGLIYEQHEVLEETERTQFAAAGLVRTADGREVRFTLQLDMQRYFRQESTTILRLGDAVAVDPLVINFDGTAAELQNLRFAFDLNGDGETENVPLLAGNRGYLALDLNQNDRIDNGLELFGPGTGNGFAELALHDSDGNGWIDEADAVYQHLRVWTPDAHGAGSLQTLADAGVGAVQLSSAATPFALRDTDNASLGAVRSTSIYLREDGGVGTVQQIDLSV